MPMTPVYGFEYETPMTKPGITLTGDSDGSAPILAEQVETVIASVDSRLASIEGDVAQLQEDSPSDTGWQTLTVTPGTNFTLTSAVYRRWGPVVAIHVLLVRTNSALTANSAGNTTDTQVATIDVVEARPDQAYTVIGKCSITSGNVDIETSGSMELTDLHSSSSLRVDDTLRIYATYFTSTFS